MTQDSKIRKAQNRVIAVITKRPEAAYSVSQGRATLSDGLKCTYTQGEHTANMDMPEIMGGDDSGPTPGFFSRAGIAGCVCMGIKQTAVLADIELKSVIVDIQTDFNNGGLWGLGESGAAPLETRLSIQVESSSPEGEISALVEKALSMDPWFLALRDAQNVRHAITVVRGE